MERTIDADDVEYVYEAFHSFLEAFFDMLNENTTESDFVKTTREESERFLAHGRNSRNSRVRWHSDKLMLVVDTDSKWHHYGVGLVVREDVYFEDKGSHDKDPGNAEELASTVFSLLSKTIQLVYSGEKEMVRSRTNAWTSCPFPKLQFTDFSQQERKVLSKHSWFGYCLSDLAPSPDTKLELIIEVYRCFVDNTETFHGDVGQQGLYLLGAIATDDRIQVAPDAEIRKVLRGVDGGPGLAPTHPVWGYVETLPVD